MPEPLPFCGMPPQQQQHYPQQQQQRPQPPPLQQQPACSVPSHGSQVPAKLLQQLLCMAAQVPPASQRQGSDWMGGAAPTLAALQQQPSLPTAASQSPQQLPAGSTSAAAMPAQRLLQATARQGAAAGATSAPPGWELLLSRELQNLPCQSAEAGASWLAASMAPCPPTPAASMGATAPGELSQRLSADCGLLPSPQQTGQPPLQQQAWRAAEGMWDQAASVQHGAKRQRLGGALPATVPGSSVGWVAGGAAAGGWQAVAELPLARPASASLSGATGASGGASWRSGGEPSPFVPAQAQSRSQHGRGSSQPPHLGGQQPPGTEVSLSAWPVYECFAVCTNALLPGAGRQEACLQRQLALVRSGKHWGSECRLGADNLHHINAVQCIAPRSTLVLRAGRPAPAEPTSLWLHARPARATRAGGRPSADVV